MVQILSTPEKNGIIARCKSHFNSRGWKVESHSDHRADLIVSKWLIRLPISCFDMSTNHTLGQQKTIARMETFSREFKTERNEALLLVTNFPFAVSLESMTSLGIIAVAPNELGIISEVAGFQSDLPNDLEDRINLLFEGNQHACLDIAHRFGQLRNYTEAIKWARRAVNSKPIYTNAHDKLFMLLLESGDLENAQKVALDAFRLNRRSLFFMRHLRSLSEINKDGSSEAKWSKLIAEEEAFEARSSSLAALFRKA